MSDLDLSALRAKAEAATPGPWRSDRKRQVGPVSTEDDQSFGMLIPCADAYSDENASFFAAANPSVVLALIDRVEKAEALADLLEATQEENSRLRSLLARAGEALRPFADEAFVWHCQIPDSRKVEIAAGASVEEATFTVGDLRTARTIAREIEEALK